MTHGQRGLTALISAVACSVLGCDEAGTVSSDGSGAMAGSGGSGDTGGSGGSGGGEAGASAGIGGSATTSGTGGVDPNVIVPTTVAELCEKLPGARGTFMARCYGGDPEEWGSFSDRPCGAMRVSEEAGRIALNQDRVAACFTALAAEACNPREVKEVSVACNDLITGSVPTGEACNVLGFEDECEPAAACEAHDPCAGTCTPRGLVGETCHGAYVYTECGAGLECDAVSAACQVPGAEGDACRGWQGVCQPGLYCDAVDQEEGTCRPKRATARVHPPRSAQGRSSAFRMNRVRAPVCGRNSSRRRAPLGSMNATVTAPPKGSAGSLPRRVRCVARSPIRRAPGAKRCAAEPASSATQNPTLASRGSVAVCYPSERPARKPRSRTRAKEATPSPTAIRIPLRARSATSAAFLLKRRPLNYPVAAGASFLALRSSGGLERLKTGASGPASSG